MSSSKKLVRRRQLVIILIGFGLSVAIIFSYFLTRPSKSSLVSPISKITTSYKQKKVNYGLPVRLKIPKIKVDAPIEPMGITLNGDMGAPKGPHNVGWYMFGPYPGNIGSAVIDGHYGHWRNGGGSVFDNLNKLKKGDSLYVVDEKGKASTFLVREVRTYDPNADATAVFKSNDGLAHLNLITCEGVWNEAQKSFSDRLIIFTDKED